MTKSNAAASLAALVSFLEAHRPGAKQEGRSDTGETTFGPNARRKLPDDIGIHRFGERALHADRGPMLVERVALEHAQAAAAHADWRRVQILIDGALRERDGLRVAPCDQKPQEALAFGQTWHGISASRARFRRPLD